MAKAKSKGPLLNGVHNLVDQQIWILAMRQYRQIKLPFTMDDLRMMFVPADWRDRLTEVFRAAAPSGVTYNLHVGVLDNRVRTSNDRPRPVTINFSWMSGHANAFLPLRGIGTSLNPILDVQTDCPSELQEKFEHMMHELCGVAQDFGQVKHVLDKLNDKDKMPTLAALRYYWPSVLPLLELAGQHDLADEVREPSPRSAWHATVPADVHDMLNPTNDFLARAMLIEDPGVVPSLPVSYQMDEVNFGFPGVTDSR